MHTKTLFYIYAIGSLFFCITFTINFSKLLKTSQQNPSTPTKMAAPKPDETKINETFYISHGSPTLSIDDSLPARHFLKSFRQKVFPQTPKSILIISGHWETSDPVVNSISGPLDTIYDFYGFPNKMYKLKYPAPGSPDLSARVIELLKKSGFKTARVDRTRGLDHGAWVPLMLMFPDADIPVCQLSVQTNRDARHHYEVGRALRELKDEGVLILGSGAATHNLGMIDRSGGGGVAKWAYEFDTWIKERLEEGKYEEVNDYEDKAPYARVAHPSPDHFYPLHVAMGAAGEGTRGELVHGSWSYGTLSYASYRFGAKSDEGRV